MGFSVPLLVGFDERRLVIEMSVVQPPFLLDFAAATVDTPHDFTADAMDLWWQQVAEDFGENFPSARDVFWGLLKSYGIRYWDLKPRNLVFA